MELISSVLTDQNNFSGATLNVRQAAAYLGWSEKMLRARMARRTVPFRRLGSRILFLCEELQQFLEALPGCDLTEAMQNLNRRREH